MVRLGIPKVPMAFSSPKRLIVGLLATSQPYIQTPDGNQVQWSSFRLVNYIIHDGWRVGLTGDYIVEGVSIYEPCMVAPIFYIHCVVPSICSMALTGFKPILRTTGPLTSA